MIKHGAAIGIGTVLLVFGLGGLALLHTGEICPRPSIGPVPHIETKTGNLETRNRDPEVKPPGPALQKTQVPSPRAGESSPLSQGVKPQTSQDQGRPKAVPVPQLGKGERRYPGQDQPAQRLSVPEGPGTFEKREVPGRVPEPESYAGRTGALLNGPASGMQPVVIRFRLDPAHDREIYVARVHSGDKIKVKVRRVGPVGRRVYFTYTNGIDSEQGALVKAVATYNAAGLYPYERGYYVIEMRIYPGNRWNIKPRSFV